MTGTIRTSYHVRQRARRHWEQQLPLPCPHCGLPVTRDTPWDIDHTLPLTLGGTDLDVRPAHARCNRRGGAAITNARKKFAKTNSEMNSAAKKNGGAVFPKPGAACRPAEPISSPVMRVLAESRDREW